ncbi:MAG TPA: hypothetical protein VIP77_06525 [Jiangellaceae bacterium]
MKPEYDDVDTTVVVETSTGRECLDCGDEWVLGRAADSINTVRWSGWFA